MPTSPETLEKTEQLVSKILSFMQIEAKVVVKADEKSRTLLVRLESADSKYLIGQHGQNLTALQHLLRHLVDHAVQSRVRLLVDVNDYREQKSQSLARLALNIASQVAERGRFEVLRPMTAYERRLIHVALADRKEVKTESLGEEPNRRVVIKPTGRASFKKPAKVSPGLTGSDIGV